MRRAIAARIVVSSSKRSPSAGVDAGVGLAAGGGLCLTLDVPEGDAATGPSPGDPLQRDPETLGGTAGNRCSAAAAGAAAVAGGKCGGGGGRGAGDGSGSGGCHGLGGSADRGGHRLAILTGAAETKDGGADGDRLADLDVDPDHGAGERGRDLGDRLVGLHLGNHVALGDAVAHGDRQGRNQPLGDLQPHLRQYDGGTHVLHPLRTNSRSSDNKSYSFE